MSAADDSVASIGEVEEGEAGAEAVCPPNIPEQVLDVLSKGPGVRVLRMECARCNKVFYIETENGVVGTAVPKDRLKLKKHDMKCRRTALPKKD